MADTGADNNVPQTEKSEIIADEAPAQGSAPAEEMLSVDFLILPEKYGQTKDLPTSTTLAQVREMLETELSVPNNSLAFTAFSDHNQVVVGGHVSDYSKTLKDCGFGNKWCIQLQINYYEGDQAGEAHRMPDILHVQTQNNEGVIKNVRVHVQKPEESKSYLGGFRQKEGFKIEYHHASSQTPVPQKEHVEKFHRETNTYEYKTRSTQEKRECGTQMRRGDIFIDERTDKVVTPQPYFSATDLQLLKLEKVAMIQTVVRGWFARRLAQKKREDRDRADEEEYQARVKAQTEAELNHKYEIQRRMKPRTKEDFHILHSELEAWRSTEATKIKQATDDTDVRQAANRMLLHKEVKLLQTIDRLKGEAQKVNKDQKIKQELDSMAAAKVWFQTDGEVTSVQTPYTIRAKELADLYKGLRINNLCVDERLDVLLHVKSTCKEFDTPLTREICSLIDREADLLNRGRSEKTMKNLRKRTSNMFHMFVMTPEFNPEAARFQKVPDAALLEAQ